MQQYGLIIYVHQNYQIHANDLKRPVWNLSASEKSWENWTRNYNTHVALGFILIPTSFAVEVLFKPIGLSKQQSQQSEIFRGTRIDFKCEDVKQIAVKKTTNILSYHLHLFIVHCV